MIAELSATLSIAVVRYALVGMVVAGATFSLLGVVVVSLHLTAMRFMLMHMGLLGAAAGISLGFSPTGGALVLVLTGSLLMGPLGNRLSLSPASISGFFMTGSLAAAFLLLAATGARAMDVFGVFAGNILMLRQIDVIVVIVVGIVIVTVFVVAYREIQLVLMDRVRAEALGVPVEYITGVLYLLLGAGIAVALRLVGALLVDAVILLPGMAALRFARNLSGALLLSGLFGALACTLGFFAAVLLDLPIGASAAAASTLILAASLVLGRVCGVEG